jgi:hypothetical protein
MAVNQGGAMYNTNDSDVIVRDCAFTNNEANVGGAVLNERSAVAFKNCTFLQNAATNFGGAMYNDNSSPLITNCVFVDNVAGERGGAVLNYELSDAEIMNCTIVGNGAGSGSAGIDNTHNEAVSDTGSEISIIGSILWGNTPTQVMNSLQSSSDIGYSNIEQDCDPAARITCDSKTINEDPSFVEGGVELMPDSPCIDQGNGWIAPPTDIVGNGRYDDPNVSNATNCGGEEPDTCIEYADMGAYEYQGP